MFVHKEEPKTSHSQYFPMNVLHFDVFGTTNNDTSYVNSKENWYLANHVVRIKDISHDKPPMCCFPGFAKVISTIVIVICLLICSYFKCVTYTYVYRTNKTNGGWMNRPINLLTITSAILHHVTHVFGGIWYVLAMMVEGPLRDKFGEDACWFMMVLAVIEISYLNVGSLGMAVFRLLYIKHEHWRNIKLE